LTGRQPAFFLVGAAKCGTTALYSYLSHHPAIFVPRLKEPKFFCSDIKSTGGVYDQKGYEALFAEAPDGAISGEASCWYLYSRVALPQIIERYPNAKIIVSLRNPIEAAQSLHAAAWAYGHENIADFEEAWHAQQDRLSGHRIPPHWPEPLTLQYGAIYRYGEQLRRLFDVVPREQRHIVVYEDFFADPVRSFTELLSFLGLAAQLQQAFPVINPAMVPRSNRLDHLLRRHPPQWLRTLYAPVRPFMRRAGLRPMEMLRRLNSAPSHRPPLREAFRAELEQYFADDVRLAESILDRPLWRTTRS
jgi:hypothetical protein